MARVLILHRLGCIIEMWVNCTFDLLYLEIFLLINDFIVGVYLLSADGK